MPGYTKSGVLGFQSLSRITVTVIPLLDSADGLVISVHHAFIKNGTSFRHTGNQFRFPIIWENAILVVTCFTPRSKASLSMSISIHKTFLSQRVIKRRLVLSNQLRIGYVVGLADLDELSSVKYSQDKLAVKLILRLLPRFRGTLTEAAKAGEGSNKIAAASSSSS